MSSLLRSTKFVRYFTGAARTLILNSAKSAESGSLINSKALTAANNIIVRDYATPRKTENLEPLLQKLDLDVRRYGRITKKDIDEVFDELRRKNNITSSQSLLVIRCCGELVPEELPEQRTLLVQKIWNVLAERGIPMDISHYNALLRVYLENEHPFSPAQFLEELEKKGLQPNRVTYQRIMWRYCQEGDVEGATRILEKMRELGLPVSEPVLNALVMGHAYHGDTDGAEAVIDTMAGAGLQPSNRTYMLLASGFAKKGDIEGVKNVVSTANKKEMAMSDKDILEIIEHLAIAGHGDKVEELFPFLQKGIGYNQDVYNLILKLLNKGQEETAKKILKTMPKQSNIEDTPFKGAFFIKQIVKLNKQPESLIKTCKELQDENLVPKAIYIATEMALQNGKVELAQLLFKELEKEGIEIRQHYYWPLLAQKCKEEDEEGLLQILRNMTKVALVPSGEALRDYVLPLLKKNDTPQNIIVKLQLANVPTIIGARNLMVEYLESGDLKTAAEVAVYYQPRGQYTLVARSLLSALNKSKDIKSFATVLHVMASKAPQQEDDTSNEEGVRDGETINEISRILKSSVKLIPDNLIEKLLTTVYSKGLRITTEAAEDIEQFLGQRMTENLSKLLTQITASELALAPIQSDRKRELPQTSIQLEKLYTQLKKKEGTNLNRIQKQLLTTYVMENNVEKLNSLLEELKTTDFELTTSTLAQLYEFYCENNDLKRATECHKLLLEKDPTFVMNPYKTVTMALALVRNGRYEEAIKHLNENKPKDLSNATFKVNSKCWQLANFLAEAKDVAKVREVITTLLENEYLEPSNIILGPLIKVHLLCDDLQGALSEFENCCNKYRSTPWKGELMKMLIMKEDASKLQWLADLSTQIHGEVNILHDLVLAFIECGRLRQARRILETPGLHTRHQRLEHACLRYVEDGKSEYLEGLLEATKELSHIDRSNIFNHLLSVYCKDDQTDKALGLWTLLQEEDEIPSNYFLQTLGNHLKSKNRPVPFIIPQTVTSGQTKPKRDVVKQTANKEPGKPTKKEVSDQIESLVKEEKNNLAMDLAIKTIQSGVLPKSNVLKYLLKGLAVDGNVEKIQLLGKYLNEDMKRNVTFDDKLTLAKFTRGAGAEHIDNLLESVKSAYNEDELVVALRKYPRSSALAIAITDENLVSKCQEIAELAAEKGQKLPANLLWMEYVIAGKNKEAEYIWTKYLQTSDVVIFRRLLQESHIHGKPELINILIEKLKTNKNISMGSLGNAYSRLINYYLLQNKLNEASSILNAALKSGVSKEDMNKTSLDRLKTALESEGKQLNFSL